MKGLVIKSTGSWYNVLYENAIYECRIKGKIRLDAISTTNPVAVGDYVEIELEDINLAIITDIYPRKNHIIRKSTNLSKQAQILAANIDMAFLVVTIHSPQTLLSFIDRFLASANAYSIPATIIINKCDIISSAQHKATLQEWIDIYTLAGYSVLTVSTVQGQGLQELQVLMKDKISLFAGNSGVGKSSIINALDSSLNIKTQEISHRHKTGQHTTTFAEMHKLQFGAYIIDSPGIRSFGMYDIAKENLSHYFPDIFKFSADCQFANCTHIHEPNCTVQDAVEHGEISLSRYENYVAMYFDTNEKHRL